MNFTLPEARRERMEQMLEYLGDTSRYSKYYDGNRAEDFKKCFDTESEWCWKYADLMLRGMEKRKLEYAERHHIVPYAHYKMSSNARDRFSHYIADSNLVSLSYLEHLFCHYLAAKCATQQMVPKMAYAFCHMWRTKHKCSKKCHLPPVDEILHFISEPDAEEIKQIQPHVAAVTNSGRIHTYEDIVAYRREYAVLNRDKINKNRMKKYHENHEESLAKQRKYASDNREKISKSRKEYRQKNIERIKENDRKRLEKKTCRTARLLAPGIYGTSG